MARPRKALEELIVAGTYRADRHEARKTGPEANVRPKARIPKAPKGMSKQGRAYFNDLCERAIKAGTLTDADIGVCRMAADLHEEWSAARAGLKAHGALIGTPGGTIKANPAISQMSTLASQPLRIESQLGLTPVSRRSVSARASVRPATSDEWDRFIFKPENRVS